MLTALILIPAWFFLLLLIVASTSLGFWIGNIDYVARLKRENKFAYEQWTSLYDKIVHIDDVELDKLIKSGKAWTKNKKH